MAEVSARTTKVMNMQPPKHRSDPDSERLHANAHISICPNQQMHLRVGNVCLHLCRRDFCQLAKAVMETLTTLEAGERRAILGESH
jgi:hypothetical protein